MFDTFDSLPLKPKLPMLSSKKNQRKDLKFMKYKNLGSKLNLNKKKNNIIAIFFFFFEKHTKTIKRSNNKHKILHSFANTILPRVMLLTQIILQTTDMTLAFFK